MKPEVRRLVESLLRQRAIERSSSPWNSPVVLVLKKDGSIRMCVDYRRLNAVTRKDAYPLPNQDALLMNLYIIKYFTALDLASGYYQIPMADKDKDKTAFSVLGELFHFLVLPFGMSTSPACFNRMMQVVFGDLIGKSVFVYLDDILIATETEEEHLLLLEEIFKRLIHYKLMLKPKKCEIARTQLCYLGHVVSDRGVELGKDKVEKVQNFPPPRTVSQVRQFIGLASCHRKFIEGFSTITSPLLALTKKDTKFEWSEKEEKAFEKLKEKLVTAPILAQPDYESAIEGSKPFIIRTDACKTGVGAVLTQEGEDKRLHPLFYISKACSEAERNYSITQLEALAVVVAMRKLRTFVMGAKDVVRTDHQPLIGLFRNANLSPQLIRWALELQEYRDLKMEFVKGKANTVADALSRCHGDSEFGDHVEVMDSVVFVIEEHTEKWFELLRDDESWTEVCEKVLKEGRCLHHKSIYGLKGDFLVKFEEQGRERKVVPVEKRKALWNEVHSGQLGGHFGAKKLRQLFLAWNGKGY
uniref:RNA-directed DNA polymerase n=1 Tax=Panagrolaimus superbus TaxID=310955 RepID=A0A914YY30_9BILA